jgi:exonuclease III
MPRVQVLRQGKAAALRIGSHNVNGFNDNDMVRRNGEETTRIHALVKLWVKLRLDIVFLQETHLRKWTQDEMTEYLNAATKKYFCGSYTAFYSSLATEPHAGVAILIRTSLITSGALQVLCKDAHGNYEPLCDKTGEWAARWIMIPVKWGGHRLNLTNLYLKSGDSGLRRRFMQERMPRLYGKPGTHIWGGDFNFTVNPDRDRVTKHRDPTRTDTRSVTAATERGDAALMQSICPDLVDLYRHLHPERTAFTYFHPQGCARLDRFHVSSRLLPHTPACTVPYMTVSDHWPVTMVLAPVSPTELGPGLPRVRMHFKSEQRYQDEFVLWLRETVETAPTSDHGLIVWWPVFKKALADMVRSLNRRLRRERQGYDEATAAAQEELRAAHAAVNSQGRIAIPAVIAARQRFVAAMLADGRRAAMKERLTWLHQGERPHPGITRMLQPGQSSRHVPVLKDPVSGALHVNPRQLPNLVAAYWADVSKQPATSAAARDRVLQAVRDQVAPLQAEQQAQLGETEVTVKEVAAALKAQKSGKAPGVDGIPAELYRLDRHTMTRLLARLFTAIGKTGIMPTGMSVGSISILHKDGCKMEMGNYRPLQLLNTDYRLLSKVLTNRLRQCLATQISPEQNAYLPGRRIGDDITFLQLLPERLKQLGKAAVIAFLDFRKAFDTVCRDFLLQVMEVMGAGTGFLNWTRLMFSDSTATAMVNGFISDPVHFQAGVKQGDPLSSVLYLYVGQALLCWLKANDIGIDLKGRSDMAAELNPNYPQPAPELKATAMQYADDTKVFLPSLSPATVQHFIWVMDGFAAASGQRLNTKKTSLLPVGWIPPEWQSVKSVAGLEVVQQAKALGMHFTNGRNPDEGTYWKERVAVVKSCFTKITGMSLSAFGRAFAGCGYGISKMLFHAEFAGMLPTAELQDLQRMTRVLVDQGRVPGQTSGRPSRPRGIPDHFLIGHPTTGGFGTMPWEQHIRGRHAWWAVRYMQYSTLRTNLQLPWVTLMTAYLQHEDPECKGYRMMHPSSFQVGGAAGLRAGTPLAKMVSGLRALPPVTDICDRPLTLGDWCAAAPIWYNPLLEIARSIQGLNSDNINFRLGDFPCMSTVRDVVVKHDVLKRLIDAVPDMSSNDYYNNVFRVLLCMNRGLVMHCMSYPFGHGNDLHETFGQIKVLYDSIPSGWIDCARLAIRKLRRNEVEWVDLLKQAEKYIYKRIGWRYSLTGLKQDEQCISVLNLSVKHATWIQLGSVVSTRCDALVLFHEMVTGATAGSTEQKLEIVKHMQALLNDVWRIKWENGRKEVYWRLVGDGFPKYTVGKCVCGVDHQCSRRHVYWDCCVAQGVLSSINAALSQIDADNVSIENVWLMRPPRGVQEGVWMVVCLAALAGMEQGNRVGYGLLAERKKQEAITAAENRYADRLEGIWRRINVNVRIRRRAAAHIQDTQNMKLKAVNTAITSFWNGIADFVAMQKLPSKTDPMELQANSPFIGVMQDGKLIINYQ